MRGTAGSTWFGLKIVLNPEEPGSYQTHFNYIQEPSWSVAPAAGEYVDEIQLMRQQGEIPEWFVRRMETAE